MGGAGGPREDPPRKLDRASVTANTRRDARELLDLASRIRIETDIEVYPLEEANEALLRLKEGRLEAQAAVLRIR